MDGTHGDGALQEGLTNIMMGTVSVENHVSQKIAGARDKIGPHLRRRIAKGFIWMDWISIPQIKIRIAEGDPPPKEARAGDGEGIEADMQATSPTSFYQFPNSCPPAQCPIPNPPQYRI